MAGLIEYDHCGVGDLVSGICLGLLLIQYFRPTGLAADWWSRQLDTHILPSLTPCAAVAAVTARFTRASFVDVLSEDYMRTARAKGVSETWVRPQTRATQRDDPGSDHDGLTVWLFARWIIVVEKVFNWPGLGRLRFILKKCAITR
ncbi:ABC transporter permease subunit [Escherichia coli]